MADRAGFCPLTDLRTHSPTPLPSTLPRQFSDNEGPVASSKTPGVLHRVPTSEVTCALWGM